MHFIFHFLTTFMALSFLSLSSIYANTESLMPHGRCARGAQMLVHQPAANALTRRPKPWNSGRVTPAAKRSKIPTNIVPFKLDSLLDRMPHGAMP